MQPHPRRFNGVYSVLATPFHDDGTLDLPGLRRVVEHQLASGVGGVVCFGLASEGYKLDDGERAAVIDVVVEAVAGRVDVVIGCDHTGTEAAAARCFRARDAGATAVMLFPPTLVKPGAAGLAEHYAAAAEAGLPVIVQDAPAWTGVTLSPDALGDLAASTPAAGFVKVEAPPTAPKIGALLDRGIECIGGYGALYLLEELERGVRATMPGCAFPRAFVEILGHHAAGRRDEARQLVHQMLSLTVLSMSSLDLFVVLQKRMLVEAGLIASDRVRRPVASVPDAQQLAFAERLIVESGAARYLLHPEG